MTNTKRSKKPGKRKSEARDDRRKTLLDRPDNFDPVDVRDRSSRPLPLDSLGRSQDSEKAADNDSEKTMSRRKTLQDRSQQSDLSDLRDRFPRGVRALPPIPSPPNTTDSSRSDVARRPPNKPLPPRPLSTTTVLADIVQQVTDNLTPNFPTDRPPNLATWSNLDPFGQLSHVPDSSLKDYPFDQLDAEKSPDFFRKINLAAQPSALPQLMPKLSELDNSVLSNVPLSSGISPLQHSVWVGNPLNAAIPKQQAFMDALVQNKTANPNWTIVLWTDQSRDTLNNAASDSLVGKMRQWAADHNIMLANIDEVFAGNNKMELNDICNLERNKGGTGRAAASDIVRLEVLNRFGGMYVDGDKAINIPLADIAKEARDNTIRLAIPTHENPPSTTPAAAISDSEIAAVANGMKIVQVTGFAAGNEKGSYQNCALCADKGNLAVQKIMQNIRSNYQKDRATLVVPSLSVPIQVANRAQRMEVIIRTGPSVVRDTVDPDRKGTALMSLDSVNTFTNTTSWTGEKLFTGNQDRAAFKGKVPYLPINSTLQNQAKLSVVAPPNLPPTSVLAPERITEIATAVQNSLTTLSYTIPNEVGRLDLNHLKVHLIGLSPDEQMLAVHATLQALTDDFKGLTGAVTTLRLPTLRDPKPDDLMLAAETLDLINSNAFSNLDLKKFTLQDAALEGNLTFLGYAQRHNLLDNLNIPASPRIDGGGEAGGDYDVIQAAIAGGNRLVIHYLTSIDTANRSMNTNHAYTGIDLLLKSAIRYGQVDTVIALAEQYNRPNSIGDLIAYTDISADMVIELLERYRGTFGNSIDLDKNSGNLLRKVIQEKALDQIPQLQQLGVNISHCDSQERSVLLSLMVNQAIDDATADDILQTAALLGIEKELLIKAGKDNKPNLITAHLNKARQVKIPVGAQDVYDDEAELAIAHIQVPKSKVRKNDYKDYQGVDPSSLTIQDAQSLAQIALVYSDDRLRASKVGRASRVNGWLSLLRSMQQDDTLMSDIRLGQIIAQAERQLLDMIAPTPRPQPQAVPQISLDDINIEDDLENSLENNLENEVEEVEVDNEDQLDTTNTSATQEQLKKLLHFSQPNAFLKGRRAQIRPLLTTLFGTLKCDFDQDDAIATKDRLYAMSESKLTKLNDRLNSALRSDSSALFPLLSEDNPVSRVILNNPKAFQVIISALPNTADSHTQIENLETSLIQAQNAAFSSGEVSKIALTAPLHEICYKKKTEILENVIESAITDTEHPGLKILEAVGKDNYWKILMDGQVHNKDNKHFYDRSKGFMASMMKGLRRIVEEIDRPLDLDFVKDLHQDATKLVTTESHIPLGFPMASTNFQATGLKRSPNAWGVTKKFSEAGLQELEALRDDLEKVGGGYFSEDDMRFTEYPDRVVQWRAGQSSLEELVATVEALMDYVITKSYNAINTAKANDDSDAVIGAIIDCCRGLGIIHPFKDANGRLIMFLVLNKLLMENEMSPTILEDQGLMIGKSKDELIELIKEGQKQVKNLIP